MDLKDVIYQLECLRAHCEDSKDKEEPGSIWHKDVQALAISIKILEGVNRMLKVEYKDSAHLITLEQAQKAYEAGISVSVNDGKDVTLTIEKDTVK